MNTSWYNPHNSYAVPPTYDSTYPDHHEYEYSNLGSQRQPLLTIYGSSHLIRNNKNPYWNNDSNLINLTPTELNDNSGWRFMATGDEVNLLNDPSKHPRTRCQKKGIPSPRTSRVLVAPEMHTSISNHHWGEDNNHDPNMKLTVNISRDLPHRKVWAKSDISKTTSRPSQSKVVPEQNNSHSHLIVTSTMLNASECGTDSSNLSNLVQNASKSVISRNDENQCCQTNKDNNDEHLSCTNLSNQMELKPNRTQKPAGNLPDSLLLKYFDCNRFSSNVPFMSGKKKQSVQKAVVSSENVKSVMTAQKSDATKNESLLNQSNKLEKTKSTSKQKAVQLSSSNNVCDNKIDCNKNFESSLKIKSSPNVPLRNDSKQGSKSPKRHVFALIDGNCANVPFMSHKKQSDQKTVVSSKNMKNQTVVQKSDSAKKEKEVGEIKKRKLLQHSSTQNICDNKGECSKNNERGIRIKASPEVPEYLPNDSNQGNPKKNVFAPSLIDRIKIQRRNAAKKLPCGTGVTTCDEVNDLVDVSHASVEGITNECDSSPNPTTRSVISTNSDALKKTKERTDCEPTCVASTHKTESIAKRRHSDSQDGLKSGESFSIDQILETISNLNSSFPTPVERSKPKVRKVSYCFQTGKREREESKKPLGSKKRISHLQKVDHNILLPECLPGDKDATSITPTSIISQLKSQCGSIISLSNNQDLHKKQADLPKEVFSVKTTLLMKKTHKECWTIKNNIQSHLKKKAHVQESSEERNKEINSTEDVQDKKKRKHSESNKNKEHNNSNIKSKDIASPDCISKVVRCSTEKVKPPSDVLAKNKCNIKTKKRPVSDVVDKLKKRKKPVKCKIQVVKRKFEKNNVISDESESDESESESESKTDESESDEPQEQVANPMFEKNCSIFDAESDASDSNADDFAMSSDTSTGSYDKKCAKNISKETKVKKVNHERIRIKIPKQFTSENEISILDGKKQSHSLKTADKGRKFREEDISRLQQVQNSKKDTKHRSERSEKKQKSDVSGDYNSGKSLKSKKGNHEIQPVAKSKKHASNSDSKLNNVFSSVPRLNTVDDSACRSKTVFSKTDRPKDTATKDLEGTRKDKVVLAKQINKHTPDVQLCSEIEAITSSTSRSVSAKTLNMESREKKIYSRKELEMMDRNQKISPTPLVGNGSEKLNFSHNGRLRINENTINSRYMNDEKVNSAVLSRFEQNVMKQENPYFNNPVSPQTIKHEENVDPFIYVSSSWSANPQKGSSKQCVPSEVVTFYHPDDSEEVSIVQEVLKVKPEIPEEPSFSVQIGQIFSLSDMNGDSYSELKNTEWSGVNTKKNSIKAMNSSVQELNAKHKKAALNNCLKLAKRYQACGDEEDISTINQILSTLSNNNDNSGNSSPCVISKESLSPNNPVSLTLFLNDVNSVVLAHPGPVVTCPDGYRKTFSESELLMYQNVEANYVDCHNAFVKSSNSKDLPFHDCK